jgi:protein SCO1/2
MRRALRIAGLVGCWVLLASCERVPNTAPPPPAKATVYDVRGVVKKVNATTGRAIIAHEEISGYMAAMTMEFDAAQPAELVGLQPGDLLTFRLEVSDTRSSIAQIRKIGRAAIPQDTATASGLPNPGTPVPNCALVNEQGQPFQLADFKGRALAFTFIFTRCPLPDFCPLMSQHFAAVRRELIAAQLGENWHLLSITIDPAHDTPERLADYAKAFRLQPGRWTFATGDAAEIRKLGAFAGLATTGEGAALEHNLRTVVVDASGRVQKIFTGNEWKPNDLAEEMKRAMRER